jgi:hypothetical protein
MNCFNCLKFSVKLRKLFRFCEINSNSGMKIYEIIELLNNISFNLLWKWEKVVKTSWNIVRSIFIKVTWFLSNLI